MTGTSGPKVFKFCIDSSNRITYHPQKWRGYGHVTVLKVCRDAARREGSSAIAELHVNLIKLRL